MIYINTLLIIKVSLSLFKVTPYLCGVTFVQKCFATKLKLIKCSNIFRRKSFLDLHASYQEKCIFFINVNKLQRVKLLNQCALFAATIPPRPGRWRSGTFSSPCTPLKALIEVTAIEPENYMKLWF